MLCRRTLPAALMCAALLDGRLAYAQDPGPVVAPPDGNLVALQAESEREVTNNQISAVFAAEAEGSDPAALAAAVNRKMSSALALVKGVSAVAARSGTYQISPVYGQDARLSSWRARQELSLESVDIPAAIELITRLQPVLTIRGLSFGLTAPARRAAEDELIAEAIAAFQRRATLVSSSLQAKGYRIRRLEIDASGGALPRPAAFAIAARAASNPGVSAESGNSRVTVRVTGQMQFY
jgi:predicted secreted protein